MTSHAMDIDISREGLNGQWQEITDKHIISVLESTAGNLKNYKFDDAEISVVLSYADHVHTLNNEYRDKDKPTNILSFPVSEKPVLAPAGPLGDLVLAYEVVKEEAQNENKTFHDHLSHLLVHGFLHLLGHDHMNDEEAEEMEKLEIEILGAIGIKNPYD